MNEPASGIRRVAFKIRSKGPGWIVRRLAAEASQPTTAPGRLLHRLARNATTLAAALPRRLHALAVPKPEDAARTLFAFYDLQVSPITFDFLWFLVGADLERRRRGLEAVHVVIVPGRAGGAAPRAGGLRGRRRRRGADPAHLQHPAAGLPAAADLHRRHPCRLARACRLHPLDLGDPPLSRALRAGGSGVCRLARMPRQCRDRHAARTEPARDRREPAQRRPMGGEPRGRAAGSSP